MRKLTSILLTILVLSCNAQEPDTHTYSDSLFKAAMDSVIIYKDSVISDRDQRIINLQSIIDTYSNDEISVIADTFNYEITDDRIKIEVNKLGHDCHVEVVDGNKRIDVYYVDYKRTVNLTE